jgi:double stranded RNA-specific editase B
MDCSTGVQAAIIMENAPGQCNIICAAKGNAFISEVEKLKDCKAIRDCHAEILARRGLILFLLREMVKAKRVAKDCCVVRVEEQGIYKYALKDGVRFHLYVSKVPCGDAAVPDGDGHLRYVKAHGQGEILTREPDGLYKMSCSDKIALWNVVGVQGALLSKILTEPIFLSSIFIGSVEKQDGKNVEDSAKSVESDAQRAFVDRLSDLARHSPHIDVLPRLEDSKTKPKAICWVANDGGLGQVIKTSTGLTEKGDTDVSKYNFFKLWTEITGCKGTYGGYKSGAKQYQTEKEGLMKFFSSNGKGKWTHKPQNADDFSL